jgi:uncharacterized protein (TIGR02611 family)
MVLGPLRPILDDGEQVAVWAHVSAPDEDRPGVVSLTRTRCLMAWNSRDESPAFVAWDEVTAWYVERPREDGHDGAVVTLMTEHRTIAFRLPLSSKARARKATRLVDQVADLAPAPSEPREDRSSEHSRRLRPERRGLRGHARRVAITIVGVLVVIVSAVFASPFVPGPGAITFLAGLAILAREYDWARDIHVWFKRTFERVLAWLRARRQERRERREQRDRSRVDDQDEPRPRVERHRDAA